MGLAASERSPHWCARVSSPCLVGGASRHRGHEYNPQRMSLQPGTRLGPYEIERLLGEGGMGVVYKARDVRLKRDVAIKVLPQEFAADAGRLRRFEQEA